MATTFIIIALVLIIICMAIIFDGLIKDKNKRIEILQKDYYSILANNIAITKSHPDQTEELNLLSISYKRKCDELQANKDNQELFRKQYDRVFAERRELSQLVIKNTEYIRGLQLIINSHHSIAFVKATDDLDKASYEYAKEKGLYEPNYTDRKQSFIKGAEWQLNKTQNL